MIFTCEAHSLISNKDLWEMAFFCHIFVHMYVQAASYVCPVMKCILFDFLCNYICTCIFSLRTSSVPIVNLPKLNSRRSVLLWPCSVTLKRPIRTSNSNRCNAVCLKLDRACLKSVLRCRRWCQRSQYQRNQRRRRRRKHSHLTHGRSYSQLG